MAYLGSDSRQWGVDSESQHQNVLTGWPVLGATSDRWWHQASRRSLMRCMRSCPPWATGGGSLSPLASEPHWPWVALQKLVPSHYQAAHVWVPSTLHQLHCERGPGPGSQRPMEGGGQVTPVQSWSLPVWSWRCIRDGSKRSVLEAGKWLLKGTNVYPKTPLPPFAVHALWSWRREDSSLWPSKKHRWWVLQSQVINSYLQPYLPDPWIPSSVWHLHLINRELISSPSFVAPSQLDVRTNVSVLARALKPES